MIPLAKSFKLPVIHQDQVIELPKDATAIAGNPFCPYSVVTYGGSVLTFQGHPEHKKTYTQALQRFPLYNGTINNNKISSCIKN